MRFEHHITETWKSIVRQPYNRRDELVEIAAQGAQHLGQARGRRPRGRAGRATHPSDILDYFRDKAEIEASGEMRLLLRNYLDKHDSVNRTAEALTRAGLAVVAARELHR